jgi:hypothetical protein
MRLLVDPPANPVRAGWLRQARVSVALNSLHVNLLRTVGIEHVVSVSILIGWQPKEIPGGQINGDASTLSIHAD